MNIVVVPKKDIDTVWPHVKDYLDKAARLSLGRFTIEEIKHNLDTKNQQLWIAFDNDKIVASAITEIMEYPKIKTLFGHFIGGIELETWKQPIVDNMAEFCRQNGCDRIEFMGRRGWGKPLKSIGWKETYRVYEYYVEN